MADHPLIDHVIRQVRHPAGHQIEHHRTRGDALAVKAGEAGPEGLIQVVNEAGLGVEELVIAGIPLAPLRIREHLNRHTTAATWAGP